MSAIFNGFIKMANPNASSPDRYPVHSLTLRQIRFALILKQQQQQLYNNDNII